MLPGLGGFGGFRALSGGYDTIAFVGSGTTSGTGGGTYNFSSLIDEAGANPTILEGDLVLFCNNNANEAGGTGPDRSAAELRATGYTDIHTDIFADDFGDVNLLCCYKIMTASPDSSLTIPNPGGGHPNFVSTIHVFRGVDIVTPIDAAAATATGTNTGVPNPPAYTPVTAGACVIATGGSALAVSNSTTHTNPAGFSTGTNHFRTIYDNRTVDGAIGTGLKLNWQVSDGAVDPGTMGGTTNADASWAAVTFALRPRAL